MSVANMLVKIPLAASGVVLRPHTLQGRGTCA
jgi:hypothetical protein